MIGEILSRQEKNLVPKDMYEVLALFFGWLGLHKFYAGKKMAGILYLVFFWTMIPFFLSLFDFVIGLFKRSDEYGRVRF